MRTGTTTPRRRLGQFLAAVSVALVAIPALAAPAVAEAGQVTIYTLPNPFAGTFGITSGPDGNVWFTEQNIGKVGKMAPDGTFLTDYATTYGDTRYIRPGPDGNLWFTEYGGAGAIGRINPTTGNLREFVVPTHFNRPYAIAAGPDGNMWFTEDGNKIGRITMQGRITEFVIPTPQSLPDQITAGSDGNMWFTESAANKIARINPQGVIREFRLPKGSAPSGIVLGPDGHLWITEQSGPPGAIARVDSTAAGRAFVTEFTVPDPASAPFNIANGPDGNMWFTDVGPNFNVGKIGRITTSGVITLFDPGVTRNKLLADITAGPGDGKMWYGLYFTSQVANITTT